MSRPDQDVEGGISEVTFTGHDTDLGALFEEAARFLRANPKVFPCATSLYYDEMAGACLALYISGRLEPAVDDPKQKDEQPRM